MINYPTYDGDSAKFSDERDIFWSIAFKGPDKSICDLLVEDLFGSFATWENAPYHTRLTEIKLAVMND